MAFTSPDRRHFCLQLGAGLAGLSAGATWASSFPERSIKIIVPFAPGAGTDAMGRLVAAKLSDLFNMGQKDPDAQVCALRSLPSAWHRRRGCGHSPRDAENHAPPDG